MKKRIITLALALVMLLSLSSNAMAAKKYTIDISSASDKTWEAAKVALTFVVNGDKSYVYSSAELGSPVLFNTGYSSTGAITLVPIRAVCNALNVPITWNNPANGNPGYAELTTSTHGKVKLYMGATSITAADGTVYEEKTYAFPDGTPIPLCLERNGRIYVPVRFLSSFVLDNPAFDWSQNRQMLTITSGKAGAWTGWSGVGVNTNIDYSRDNAGTVQQRFPNAAMVAEKYGETLDLNKYFVVDTHLGAAVCNYCDTTMVKGFDYSGDDAERYEAWCALLKDVVDSESYNALMKVVEEANRLGNAWTKASNENSGYKEARAAMLTYDIPIFESNEWVKYGNVYASWDYDNGGEGLNAVFLTMDNSIETPVDYD